MDIRFLGQSCFEISAGHTRLLVDPFLTGNPKAAASADEVEPTHILLTHGHADHLGDTVDIAKRTGASVIAIVELANEIGGAGVENVVDPNLGGTVEFAGGWVRLVPAWHTAVTPDGTPHTPAGLVINLDGKTVYHLGDTCLFSDLALPGKRDSWTWRWCPSAATTRWIATTPSRPSIWSARPRSSRATTTRSRRSRPTPRRSQSDVQDQTKSKVVVLEPGDTHSA